MPPAELRAPVARERNAEREILRARAGKRQSADERFPAVGHTVRREVARQRHGNGQRRFHGHIPRHILRVSQPAEELVAGHVAFGQNERVAVAVRHNGIRFAERGIRHRIFDFFPYRRQRNVCGNPVYLRNDRISVREIRERICSADLRAHGQSDRRAVGVIKFIDVISAVKPRAVKPVYLVLAAQRDRIYVWRAHGFERNVPADRAERSPRIGVAAVVRSEIGQSERGHHRAVRVVCDLLSADLAAVYGIDKRRRRALFISVEAVRQTAERGVHPLRDVHRLIRRVPALHALARIGVTERRAERQDGELRFEIEAFQHAAFREKRHRSVAERAARQSGKSESQRPFGGAFRRGRIGQRRQYASDVRRRAAARRAAEPVPHKAAEIEYEHHLVRYVGKESVRRHLAELYYRLIQLFLYPQRTAAARLRARHIDHTVLHGHIENGIALEHAHKIGHFDAYVHRHREVVAHINGRAQPYRRQFERTERTVSRARQNVIIVDLRHAVGVRRRDRIHKHSDER